MLNKTIELIDDIINKSEAKSNDFYSDLTSMMSSLYLDDSIGIFFLENAKCETKSIFNKTKIKNYKLDQSLADKIINCKNKSIEIKTKEDKAIIVPKISVLKTK